MSCVPCARGRKGSPQSEKAGNFLLLQILMGKRHLFLREFLGGRAKILGGQVAMTLAPGSPPMPEQSSALTESQFLPERQGDARTCDGPQ